MNKNFLIQNGINYDEGVERLMGNKELYESLLIDFLNNFSFEEIKNAYQSKQYQKMYKLMHNLKGTSGSLCLVDLYEKSKELTEALRLMNYSSLELLYTNTAKAYEDTISIIKSSYAYVDL